MTHKVVSLMFVFLMVGCQSRNSLVALPADTSPIRVSFQVTEAAISTAEVTPPATEAITATPALFGEGEIMLSKSYYPDEQWKHYVQEVYFKPHLVSLTNYLVMEQAPNISQMIGGEAVKGYYGYEGYVRYLQSGGDAAKMEAVRASVSFILELTSGEYVEIRAARDPKLGTCEMYGVSIDGSNVFAAVKDVDGMVKLLSYLLKDKVLELQSVVAYSGNPALYSLHIDPNTSFSVGKNLQQKEVRVYDKDNIQVATTRPCEDVSAVLPTPPS